MAGKSARLAFHNNDVLIDKNCVSGIVDWEGSYSGDCAFDLARTAREILKALDQDVTWGAQ